MRIISREAEVSSSKKRALGVHAFSSRSETEDDKGCLSNLSLSSLRSVNEK